MHAECMAEDTNVSVYVYNPHYIWTVQDQEKMSSGKRVFEAVKEVFIERQRHHFFFFKGTNVWCVTYYPIQYNIWMHFTTFRNPSPKKQCKIYI